MLHLSSASAQRNLIANKVQAQIPQVAHHVIEFLGVLGTFTPGRIMQLERPLVEASSKAPRGIA